MDHLRDLGLEPSRDLLEDLNALSLLSYQIILFLGACHVQASSPQTRLRIQDREGGSSVDGALAYDCSWTFPVECAACIVVYSKIPASFDALVVM